MRDLGEISSSLKDMIVQRLELKISPEDIANDAPLFNEGLGLDSVEALEIVVGIEEVFGTAIEEADNLKEKFYSISTMAAYIAELLQNKEKVGA